ncbi:MAG: hypothetical protein U1E76_20085 [Planctomycetota bacterium]
MEGLDWHAGQAGPARAQLLALSTEIEDGNVARVTAARLLADLDAGKSPEKALELIGPEWE